MIIIDYQDRRPLYEQIVGQFKNLIIRGALAEDTQLPSVRSLAMELSINPNTIQRAYAELERQGFIYPVKGRGNFVASGSKITVEKKKDYRKELSDVIAKGKEIGITKEEMFSLMEDMWREDHDRDKRGIQII